jgi:hypothetical protein
MYCSRLSVARLNCRLQRLKEVSATLEQRRALPATVEDRITGVSQPIHRFEPALNLALLLFLTAEQLVGEQRRLPNCQSS